MVKLRALSLGAGVQSTTMALLAAQGEIEPMPDCAIFADTGAEPRSVYDHLRWLMSPNVLPFPVHVIQKGNLREDAMRGAEQGSRFASIPFFLDRRDEGIYDKGMGRRQCTKEYKIEPLMRKQRELLGYQPRQRIAPGTVEVWIGISLDEAVRMKPPRYSWQVNRWPLIEKKMTRWDCLLWLERNGYPKPPKSACSFCPYRSDASWRHLRDTDPDSFDDAVKLDHAMRKSERRASLKAMPYLHASLKPLDEVDFSTAEERGQLNLFGNECEGMCGV